MQSGAKHLYRDTIADSGLVYLARPVEPHGTPAGRAPVRLMREAQGEGSLTYCILNNKKAPGQAAGGFLRGTK